MGEGELNPPVDVVEFSRLDFYFSDPWISFAFLRFSLKPPAIVESIFQHASLYIQSKNHCRPYISLRAPSPPVPSPAILLSRIAPLSSALDWSSRGVRENVLSLT